MAANCKWLTVPQGPFSEVLKYLVLEDRLKVHDTCKLWKGKAVYFFNRQTEINYQHARHASIDELTLVRLASLCPNLETASIVPKGDFMSDRSISVLLLTCKKLSCFALEGGRYNLTERTLSAFKARSALPQYTALTSLQLRNVLTYSDKELAVLVTHCTQLQHLVIRNCRNLGNGTIDALINHCPNLRSLRVTNSHAIHFYPEGDSRNDHQGGIVLDSTAKQALQDRFKNGCEVVVSDSRISYCIPRKRVAQTNVA